MMVPEVKGHTVVQIDRKFELELPSRQFKRWGGGTETSDDEQT